MASLYSGSVVSRMFGERCRHAAFRPISIEGCCCRAARLWRLWIGKCMHSICLSISTGRVRLCGL